jgi:hypothetical protein
MQKPAARCRRARNHHHDSAARTSYDAPASALIRKTVRWGQTETNSVRATEIASAAEVSIASELLSIINVTIRFQIFDPFNESANCAAGNGEVRHGDSMISGSAKCPQKNNKCVNAKQSKRD